MDNVKRDFNNPRPSDKEVREFVSAAGQGDVGTVTNFVEKYPDYIDILDYSNFVQKTALMSAAWSGQKEIIELLLANGAELEKKNPPGETAMLYAVRSDDPATANLLIDNGADVNTSRESPWTPIMEAAWHGQTDMLRLLLKSGANPNIKDERGLTALQQVETHCLSLPSLDPKLRESYQEVAAMLEQHPSSGIPIKKWKHFRL